MDSETSHQPKQERLRTRWTASLDKIFADLVVEQIQLGNRPNDVFDKKTWNHIRDSFNKQTDLNFNNNQLRKHLDVLRTRYYNLKSAYDQNDFVIDDSCCIGFDLWEQIGALHTAKVKDCPIYEQLCMIFTESGVDGKYAQSSHYEELVKKSVVGTDSAAYLDNGTPISETPSSSNPMPGKPSISEKVNKDVPSRGKKRPLESQSSFNRGTRNQGITDVIAESMLEMVAASKLKTVAATHSDDRFSISNCIKALDEIEAVDDRVYFYALDLFEEPDLREMFISLNSSGKRSAWLSEKYSSSISTG